VDPYTAPVQYFRRVLVAGLASALLTAAVPTPAAGNRFAGHRRTTAPVAHDKVARDKVTRTAGTGQPHSRRRQGGKVQERVQEKALVRPLGGALQQRVRPRTIVWQGAGGGAGVGFLLGLLTTSSLEGAAGGAVLVTLVTTGIGWMLRSEARLDPLLGRPDPLDSDPPGDPQD
jgi:hypothetical protein